MNRISNIITSTMSEQQMSEQCLRFMNETESDFSVMNGEKTVPVHKQSVVMCSREHMEYSECCSDSSAERSQSQSQLFDDSSDRRHDDNDSSSGRSAAHVVEVLDNGLEIVNGVIELPFDPPIDKPLRYTNQLQYLRNVMTKYLCRYKSALPFLKPVDAISLKIPDYYKIIKSPMDLTTIKQRLLFLWYANADECLRDLRLIFDNCYTFNSNDNYVYKAGKRLEEYLDEKLKEMPAEEVELPCPPKPSIDDLMKKVVKRKAESTTAELSDMSFGEWSERGKMTTRREHGLQVKRPNKDLPIPMTVTTPTVQPTKKVPLNEAMRYCLDFVKDMMAKKHREYAWPFYEAVSIDQYPDYLTIIKKPIDLSTIKTKIETGQYANVKGFVKDMRQMFTNCLRYNKPDAPVIAQAKSLREFFEYKYAKMPEALLHEEMSYVNNNGNYYTNGIDGALHHNSGSKKSKNEDNDVPVLEGEAQQRRMQNLENQVKLLTNAMSALTGGAPKTKNGAKKLKTAPPPVSSTKRGRKRVPNESSSVRSPQTKHANNNSKRMKVANNNNNNNRRKKNAVIYDNGEDLEDDMYEEKESVSLIPSPIVFQYNDMEDLKQLKTDLENLNAKDLKNVLRILQTTEPSIRCDNDENIEIDFEVLKPETLIALRKFVSSCMLNNIPKKNKSSINGSESKKKHEKNVAKCDNINNTPLNNSKSTALSYYPSSPRLSESSSDKESSDSSSDSDSSDNDN